MKSLRLIDWLKLAPFALAALLLAGCGAPEGDVEAPADVAIDAETSDMGIDEPVVEEEIGVETIEEPAIEPAPEAPGTEATPEETPAP